MGTEYFAELYFEARQGQWLFLAVPHYVHFGRSQTTLFRLPFKNKKAFIPQQATVLAVQQLITW